MSRTSLAPVRRMIILFILLTALFITGRSWFAKNGIDNEVLIVGNLVLFVVSLVSFILTQRSLKSPNPQAFVRAVYGSFIIKFFVIVIAAFVYMQVAKKNVNKTGLFICMGLYIIYTIIEVSALFKLLRKKKDA